MMGSYFQTIVHMDDILFKGWDTNSSTDVLIASLITFVITFLYEGAKVMKAYIIIRRLQSPLTYGQNYQPMEAQSPVVGSTGSPTGGTGGSGPLSSSTAELLSSLKIPSSLDNIRKWRISLFVMESLIHLVNFFYGYLLMLVVMTYSVWLLLAVLIGSAMGYFLFEPVRQMYSDKYLKDPNCCVRTGRSALSPGATPQTINTQVSQDTSLLQNPPNKSNYQSVSSCGKD